MAWTAGGASGTESFCVTRGGTLTDILIHREGDRRTRVDKGVHTRWGVRRRSEGRSLQPHNTTKKSQPHSLSISEPGGYSLGFKDEGKQQQQQINLYFYSCVPLGDLPTHLGPQYVSPKTHCVRLHGRGALHGEREANLTARPTVRYSACREVIHHIHHLDATSVARGLFLCKCAAQAAGEEGRAGYHRRRRRAHPPIASSCREIRIPSRSCPRPLLYSTYSTHTSPVLAGVSVLPHRVLPCPHELWRKIVAQDDFLAFSEKFLPVALWRVGILLFGSFQMFRPLPLNFASTRAPVHREGAAHSWFRSPLSTDRSRQNLHEAVGG